MLLLALGQYVSRDLITAEFEDDIAASWSGLLIERFLAKHNNQLSQDSIWNLR